MAFGMTKAYGMNGCVISFPLAEKSNKKYWFLKEVKNNNLNGDAINRFTKNNFMILQIFIFNRKLRYLSLVPLSKEVAFFSMLNKYASQIASWTGQHTTLRLHVT